MLSTHTKKIAVFVVVCTVATSGIAAGVYGGTGVASDVGDDAPATVADEVDAEGAPSEGTRAQAEDGPVVIEPGETVTGELGEVGPDYVFEIEPGETATIEYSLARPTDSSMVYTSSIWAELPDGRDVPEFDRPRGYSVRSGETKTFNVTTAEAGLARIEIRGNDPRASGAFELSLSIERTGDVPDEPDEPNDDRANATKLELSPTEAGLNATKSAELSGSDPDLDYYTFTVPDYRTPEYPRSVRVPVTVTVDRESSNGISVLNVDTVPAGQGTDTVTRYVGTGNPTSVRFTAAETERYYVAVANVEEGDGPYDLTVTVNESAIDAEPAPENETQSLDEISKASYGIPFDELSEPTARLVRAVHDRQDSETKLTRDELAHMRYEMAFGELSGETRAELTTLYRAQFADG